MRSGLSGYQYQSEHLHRLREFKKNLCVDNQSPESTHTKGTATYKKWVLIFATYNEVRFTIECALQS